MNDKNKKRIGKARFKQFNGYVVDRHIGKAVLILTWIYLFIVAWSQGFDMKYYKCSSEMVDGYKSNDPAPCKNPFYKPASWVNSEFLPVGEYGQKPGPLLNSAWLVVTLFFVIGGLVNHFWHNRRSSS